MEVEILVAEVGDGTGAQDQMFHILYDGTVEDEQNYAAMGGQADEIRPLPARTTTRKGSTSRDAVQLGVRALTVTQNKTPDRARPRGGRARPRPRRAEVPPHPAEAAPARRDGA